MDIPKDEPEKIADMAAQKIIDMIGRPGPVKKIRNSQLASAILGTIGFALFINGSGKILGDIPPIMSIFLGISVMVIAGALFQRLTKN